MTPDGTIDLFASDLPADRAAAALERINHLVRSLPRQGDRRTADQRRADVLLDLLLGTLPHEASGSRRNRGVIDLRVDLLALAGLTDDPGELAGYGPVIADLARRIAEEHPDAEWRYTITGDDGEIVATGTTRRRPTSAQRRHIQARDGTCIFPGCRRPARQVDLDHRRRWADGGATHPGNQAPLCRYHHDGKDRLGWRYRPLDEGRYEWTSPLGHRYTSGRHP